MERKFKKFEWVRITEEFLRIYPYNSGLIGMVQGYGHNPKYVRGSADEKLVIVKWVDREDIGYVREKILVAL